MEICLYSERLRYQGTLWSGLARIREGEEIAGEGIGMRARAALHIRPIEFLCLWRHFLSCDAKHSQRVQESMSITSNSKD